ncbi:hypothetical protein CY34DRAFT_803404 [Suillus luteus UH-Slu-Lm8-n1]|uniref:Uncharacterized protein n=1 Tax=Suillus luteus UH-Slu-Lm8-n1 TaxID=930992 RepID=A0A0D0B1A1_9AGAM|nr:hypothetical protein CY34DRAFT_803404 [Suillus luteus UH-Slu-Lm8-n1]
MHWRGASASALMPLAGYCHGAERYYVGENAPNMHSTVEASGDLIAGKLAWRVWIFLLDVSR